MYTNSIPVLVVGHSQTKYFDRYFSLDNVDVRSFSGYMIEQMLDEIKHLIPTYAIVCIHIGANDLNTSSLPEILRSYQNLVENIHTLHPKCLILMSGILPRHMNLFPGNNQSEQFLNLINAKALSVNRSLHRISEKINYLRYIGHPRFRLDRTGRYLLARDGLHLSFAGTASVVDDIAKCIVSTRRDIQRKSQEILSKNIKDRTIAPENILSLNYMSKQSTQIENITNINSTSEWPSLPATHLPKSQTVSSSPLVPKYKSNTFPDTAIVPRPILVSCVEFTSPNSKTSSATSSTQSIPIETKEVVNLTKQPDLPATESLDNTKTSFEVVMSADTSKGTKCSSVASLAPVSASSSLCSKHSFSDRHVSPERKSISYIHSNSKLEQHQSSFPMSSFNQSPPKTFSNNCGNDDIPVRATNKVQVGGGPEPNCVVYKTSSAMLNFREVIDILNDPEERLISNIPPLKPQAGEIYVTENVADVTCDQYFWVNKGSHNIPHRSPTLQRRDYKSKTCNGDKVGDDRFRRIIYFSKVRNIALVHYLGDESVAIEFPHGNATKKTQPHRKTLKTTMNDLRNKCKDKEPNQVYKDSVNLVGISAVQQGISNAKNKKQLENLRYNENTKRKITHDSAYNTLELAYSLDSFVAEYTIYPELRVVLASKDLTDEVNRLLCSKNIDPVLFSYDTTFELGDFYVSPLIVKHPFFKGNCCFPVAFLIHDRKSQKTHDTFWREIITLIPNLLKCQPVIVIDREVTLSNAIIKYIPNAKIFLCWNHIKNDIKFWVKKHGGKSDDVAVYVRQIDEILRSDSETNFNSLVEKFSDKWSLAFRDHFTERISDELKSKACKYELEKFDLYDSYSGITNNISEGFNTVYKHLVGWKHVPLDSMVLSFYFLQQFYIKELLRGLCDVGDFQLKTEYRNKLVDPSLIDIPQNVVDPSQIVQHVKCEIESFTSDELQKDNDIPENATILADENDTNMKIIPASSSQRSIALQAIKENRVFHCAQAKAFIVEGSKGDKYSVTLYPEKCVCPALGTCWHILAARLSIGMDEKEDKKVYNLTQLNRNAKKRPNKNAGKKRPRPIDRLDEEQIINPAPDAITNKSRDDTQNPISSPLKKCEKNNLSVIKEESVSHHDKSLKSSFISPTKIKFNKTFSKNEESIQQNEPYNDRNETTCNSPVFKGKKRKLSFVKTEVQEKSEERKNSKDHERNPNENSPLKSPSSTSWIIEGRESLGFNDKDIILKRVSLSCDIINFSSKIIKKQYNIHGLQDTGKVPVLNNSDKWEYGLPFQTVKSSPAAQIHHTGHEHWVLSILHDDQVYLIDSLKSKRNLLTASLEIQLSQLYDIRKVIIPSVQQQQNSVDCGVFAIAYLIEFCENDLNQLTHVTFDTCKMRDHLSSCIETKVFSPFPKTLRRAYHRKVATEEFFIQADCFACPLPDLFDDMIMCENEECQKWYHMKCVDINKSICDTLIFICENCDK